MIEVDADVLDDSKSLFGEEVARLISTTLQDLAVVEIHADILDESQSLFGEEVSWLKCSLALPELVEWKMVLEVNR